MHLITRTMGMLLGMSLLTLGSCQQDKDVPRVTEQTQTKYQQLQLRLTAEAVQEAFRMGSARAISYDLGDGAASALPKISDISGDTPVLGIVRSSNAEQPINYFRLKLTKQTDATGKTTYSITQADPKADEHGHPTAGGGDLRPVGHETEAISFNYDDSKSLGTLSMMLIVGGELSQEGGKQVVTFGSQVAPVTKVGTNYTATGLDIPYMSEWLELEIENEAKVYLKARLKEGERFHLRPQGALINMSVENEMEGRHVTLKGFTIRSTAYAGMGKYTFDDAAIHANTAGDYRPAWSFTTSMRNKMYVTTYDLGDSALDLPYLTDGWVEYDKNRNLSRNTNAPHLLTWVMPTEDALEGTNVSAEGLIQTEVLANVADARIAAGTGVYTNSDQVDAEEDAGKAIVPRMSALPAFGSKRLANVAGAESKGVVSGKVYPMTLNLSREPMTFDLMSQYPVARGGAAFCRADFSDLGYFSKTEYGDQVGKGPSDNAQLAVNFPIINSQPKWKGIPFEVGAVLFSIRPNPSDENSPYIGTRFDQYEYPEMGRGVGWYKVDQVTSTNVRANAGFTWSNRGSEGFVAYAFYFYPTPNEGADNRNGRHLFAMRYEYAQDISGMPVMKMTQRYIGTYALELGQIPRTLSPGGYQNLSIAEAAEFIGRRTYWNDPLRAQDDIVRYFPLAGAEDMTTGQPKDKGVKGYVAIGTGSGIFDRSGIWYSLYGQGDYGTGQTKIPVWLIRRNWTVQ